MWRPLGGPTFSRIIPCGIPTRVWCKAIDRVTVKQETLRTSRGTLQPKKDTRRLAPMSMKLGCLQLSPGPARLGLLAAKIRGADFDRAAHLV
jgi:hypothetical protein